jgi:hypothetical protein
MNIVFVSLKMTKLLKLKLNYSGGFLMISNWWRVRLTDKINQMVKVAKSTTMFIIDEYSFCFFKDN